MTMDTVLVILVEGFLSNNKSRPSKLLLHSQWSIHIPYRRAGFCFGILSRALLSFSSFSRLRNIRIRARLHNVNALCILYASVLTNSSCVYKSNPAFLHICLCWYWICKACMHLRSFLPSCVCRNMWISYFFHRASAAHKCYIHADSTLGDTYTSLSQCQGRTASCMKMCSIRSNQHANQLFELTHGAVMNVRLGLIYPFAWRFIPLHFHTEIYQPYGHCSI